MNAPYPSRVRDVDLLHPLHIRTPSRYWATIVSCLSFGKEFPAGSDSELRGISAVENWVKIHTTMSSISCRSVPIRHIFEDP